MRSLRQIVQEFGEEVLTYDMKKEFDENPDNTYKIFHLVTPRTDAKLGKMSKSNKKFASYHVLEQGKILLKEGGFDNNPYIVGRWSKVPGEKYGRSPAMKCLADIKMVNEMAKAVIVGAQKTINPPMQVPDDGVLLPVRLTPGGLNFYRAGTKDRIEPLMTGARPDIGEQLIRDVEEKIKQAFFIDQLQIRMADRMTATEVMQRRDEQLRLLGPILGRQEFEFLKPLITRLFSIADKRGLIPEPPMALEKKNLKVKYTSQLARIQRTSELDNLTRVFNLVSPLAAAKPEMLDNFDGDNMLRTLADKYSLPTSYMKSEDAVEQIRQAKAEQMQQQMQMQQQSDQLDVAAKANQMGM